NRAGAFNRLLLVVLHGERVMREGRRAKDERDETHQQTDSRFHRSLLLFRRRRLDFEAVALVAIDVWNVGGDAVLIVLGADELHQLRSVELLMLRESP